MSMMDLLTHEQAIEALEDALCTRKAFIDELHKLDNLIFFLNYYLNSGEALNPEYIDLPGEEDDEG